MVLIPIENDMAARVFEGIWSEQIKNHSQGTVKQIYLVTKRIPNWLLTRLTKILPSTNDKTQHFSTGNRRTFICDINVDLDKVYTIDKIKLTLRDMILSITSSKKETEKDQLFHMIDYTPDSTSQWFRGRWGPRGIWYILSHSRKLKEEALSIVEWLPV